MDNKPTIFLTNEWDVIGDGEYDVVAFSGKGLKKAREIIQESKDNECWICIRATLESRVKEHMRGCLLSLIKFVPTDEPMVTLEHITEKAAQKPHRVNKKGKIKWRHCFKIKEICHAQPPYQHASYPIPNIEQYYDLLWREKFVRLQENECDAVLDYFKNFKWQKV